MHVVQLIQQGQRAAQGKGRGENHGGEVVPGRGPWEPEGVRNTQGPISQNSVRSRRKCELS